MTIFIAYAEADQTAAEDLRDFFKSRGQMVELETGERGFRHLGLQDAVVALWSNQSVFGRYRMMMEKRMLDAWADQQLVLVKLDHGFLPVGLRDQKAVDASFEASRKLAAWPEVLRAVQSRPSNPLSQKLKEMYRDNADLDVGIARGKYGASQGDAEASFEMRMEPSPAPAFPPGGSLRDRLQASEPKAERSRLEDDRYRIEAPKSRRGGATGPAQVVTLVVAFAAIGWAVWRYSQHPGLGWAQYIPEMAVGGLAVLLALRALMVRMGVTRRATKKVAAAAPRPAAKEGTLGGALAKMDKPLEEVAAAAPAPAPMAAEAAPATDTAVFISYAHADNGQVEPVVKIVEANGREVWIDRQGIQAGEGWAGEIVRAIRGAKGVMVMCSPRAFESDHIKREVYLADRYKKPMLPVFLEQAKMPDDFEFFFAGVQWLELFKLPEGERETAIRNALASI